MATPKTRLEMIRRQRFLSQKDVANELGMSTVNYSKIERGQRRLTIDIARKLVAIFELNYIEDLLDDEYKAS